MDKSNDKKRINNQVIETPKFFFERAKDLNVFINEKGERYKTSRKMGIITRYLYETLFKFETKYGINNVYPSLKLISEVIGVSPDTVTNHINILVNNGYIIKTQRKTKEKGWDSNEYFLLDFEDVLENLSKLKEGHKLIHIDPIKRKTKEEISQYKLKAAQETGDYSEITPTDLCMYYLEVHEEVYDGHRLTFNNYYDPSVMKKQIMDNKNIPPKAWCSIIRQLLETNREENYNPDYPFYSFKSLNNNFVTNVSIPKAIKELDLDGSKTREIEEEKKLEKEKERSRKIIKELEEKERRGELIQGYDIF